MVKRTLKLKIHEESELYSTLDPDGNTISEDVTSYLTRRFISQHR